MRQNMTSHSSVNLPYETFAHAFEETFRPLGLCPLDGFHLSESLALATFF